MAGNLFKTIQSFTDVFRNLSLRLYSRPANVPKINLDRNTALDGDALQVQFLKYIGISNAKDYNTEKSKIKYSEFFPITDPRILKQNISEVDIPDFPTLINFLYTYNTRAQSNNVLSCINLIERETCAKLDVMDSKTIFQILFAYMFLIPAYTNQLRFYENALMKLNNEIDTLSKEHLVQYGFYLGLCKTSNSEFSNIMKNVLLVLSDKYLENLTLDELCIVTNASFKMSIKINSIDMLDHISQTLIDGISQNELGPARTVTLLKSLRLSRYCNVELLKSLSQLIKSQIDELSTTAISHIVPYYADNYYKDEEVLLLMTNKFLKEIHNQTPNPLVFESYNVRGKDLTRFLWALSHLGYQLDHHTCEKFENIILKKFNNGDYKAIDDCINCSISFCMMNYIPKRLLQLVLTDRFIKTKSTNNRSEERRNLLLSILNIEYNEIFEEVPQLLNFWNDIKDQSTEPMTRNRKVLEQVLNVVVHNDFGLSDIKLQCQIPFLNTPGISAVIETKKTPVHIEVLDEGVCIRNKESIPHGDMALKLRLLKSISNDSVIVINAKELENQDEEQVKALLKERLSKFL